MKTKKIFLFIVLLTLFVSVLACRLPFSKTDTVEEKDAIETEEQYPGWALYVNRGVQLMLPDTYQLGDIEQEVPQLGQILQSLAQSQAGGSFQSFFDNLVKDIVMYATNRDGNLSNPTRMAIVRNKSFAYLPLSMTSMIDLSTLSEKIGTVTETRMTIGGRDVVRFTAIQQTSAEAVYLFKDSGRLWVITFVTTPQQMNEYLPDFEKSISTFTVTSVEE